MSLVSTRPFELDKDLSDVKRIWREVGWVEDDHGEKQLDHFFAVGSTLLGSIDGTPECSVHTVPGSMNLLGNDLPLCAVTAVTTSRVARGHQFAQRLTAAQLQEGAEHGAAVAALGMFDQGFYDKVGFGTGGYDHEFQFDPASLNVSGRARPPSRLKHDDYAAMHQVLLARPRHHGSVVLDPPLLLRAELGFEEDGFGLGYYDGAELTHFMWFDPEGERGPYSVRWLGYRNTDQLIELLVLLKSLADQVYSAKLIEPPEVQFQALLDRPFRDRALTRDSKHSAFHRAVAWWQVRILELEPCVRALRWYGDDEIEFSVMIDDPVERYLEGGEWRGLAGAYNVSFGRACHIEPRKSASSTGLKCSLNAFSRMVWGVAKPSSLAVTDDFAAEPELLQRLDAGLLMPTPRTFWDF